MDSASKKRRKQDSEREEEQEWTWEDEESRGLLQTFDLSTKEFDGGISGGFLHFEVPRYDAIMRDEPALLHLGRDSFCFLTLKELDPDPVLPRPGLTRTRIIKFRDPNLSELGVKLASRLPLCVTELISLTTC
ncbi:hypothetical protein RHSIM_Rhsim08G0165100 [Rhododendron simsii]|uniref:Uncharacterized protein n=1 Tax=Rhododendron simsii TaxID=118357 RepID=A0A834GJC3_RHOSS|nr:hypothetical protein RHSIM_Rhsim08G0165100 [Rhododendron simsii]